VNVGAALAKAGHRVLMIDLDPQAHMTLHLGLNPADGRPGVYEVLTGTATVAAARTRVHNNMWVLGASIDLAAAEVELVSIVGREVILRDLLTQHAGEDGPAAAYDYVIMDCPPSLGVLTLNGLCAAREVIIPLQPHYLALQGLSKLLETVSLVDKRINPGLAVTGVVICMKEAGTRLGAEVVEDVRSFLEGARNTPVPWRSAHVFETSIRRNIKLAEAPSYGQSIFDYASDSNGAKDYESLAAEIHDPAGYATRGLTPVAAGPAPQPAEAPASAEVVEPAPVAEAPCAPQPASDQSVPGSAVAPQGVEQSVADSVELAQPEVAFEAPVETAPQSAEASDLAATDMPATIPMPPTASDLPDYGDGTRAAV
jgi:chromosome partitioning protein